MRVSERAHAKLNLALHIMGRRPDGYHQLDSIVAFADVADVLTVSPAAAVSLEISGPFAGELRGDGTNSVVAAWHLLDEFSRRQGTTIAPVEFKLEKNLPVAAGLGGGSADAAAALRALVKLFDLAIPAPALEEMALQLGADVPVCLAQATSRMGGIGEILEPVSIGLPSAAVLVNPRIPAPTAKVFDALGLARGQSLGTAIADLGDFTAWRNDLTLPAIAIVPEISAVLASLESQPEILCARMSGSGATCFGLTENLEQAQATAKRIAEAHPGWWVVAVMLL